MHWLWKIPRHCTLWGTQMSIRTLQTNSKKLIPVQWGNQEEVPAKFNFASDVIDHWANMEKVTGERMAQLGGLHSLISSLSWGWQVAYYVSDSRRSCEQDVHLL